MRGAQAERAIGEILSKLSTSARPMPEAVVDLGDCGSPKGYRANKVATEPPQLCRLEAVERRRRKRRPANAPSFDIMQGRPTIALLRYRRALRGGSIQRRRGPTAVLMEQPTLD